MTELEDRIAQLENQMARLAQSGIPDHFHNGNDTSRLQFTDIQRKKFYVSYTLPYKQPGTLAYY